MTTDLKKRLDASLFQAVIFACFAMLPTSAFCQGAADRASARTDTTRATTEGRFQRLDQNRYGVGKETIVREELITVPVKKPAAKRSSAKSESIARQKHLIMEPAVKPAPDPTEGTHLPTKRVIVHRTETVKRVAPVKINPY